MTEYILYYMGEKIDFIDVSSKSYAKKRFLEMVEIKSAEKKRKVRK